MGTVSGPFLIIRGRNLSVVFDDDDDDDTRAFPPPDLLNEFEDATTLVFFLNRADSLDSVAVFEDIEAAEDDAVRNMISLSLYLFFFSSSSSSSSFFSLSLSRVNCITLSFSLSSFVPYFFLLLLARECGCRALWKRESHASVLSLLFEETFRCLFRVVQKEEKKDSCFLITFSLLSSAHTTWNASVPIGTRQIISHVRPL